MVRQWQQIKSGKRPGTRIAAVRPPLEVGGLVIESPMMFFTGFTRFSAEIQASNRIGNSTEKKQYLDEMYGLVGEAEKILTNKHSDLDEFGRLLDISWQWKKKTGKAISTRYDK